MAKEVVRCIEAGISAREIMAKRHLTQNTPAHVFADRHFTFPCLRQTISKQFSSWNRRAVTLRPKTTCASPSRKPAAARLFVHEFAAGLPTNRTRQAGSRGCATSRENTAASLAPRGYTPSDIPVSDRPCCDGDVRDEAIAILDHLKIKTAHRSAAGARRGGLSMRAYSSLQAGIKAPKRALS